MEKKARTLKHALIVTVLTAVGAPLSAADDATIPFDPAKPLVSADAVASLETLAGALNAPLTPQPASAVGGGGGNCGTSGECNYVECDIDCDPGQVKQCNCVADGECGPFWDRRPAYSCECTCFNEDPEPEPKCIELAGGYRLCRDDLLNALR